MIAHKPIAIDAIAHYATGETGQEAKEIKNF